MRKVWQNNLNGNSLQELITNNKGKQLAYPVKYAELTYNTMKEDETNPIDGSNTFDAYNQWFLVTRNADICLHK